MSAPNVVLARHMQITIEDAFVQYEHAQSVKTSARTGYYKVTILLLASVVEALLYDLIDIKTTADPSLFKIRQYPRYEEVETLKGHKIGLSEDLYVCRKVSKDFELGKKAMLDQMNQFCRDADLIPLKLSKQIEYVMKKRNEIHLQGLDTINRTYTSAMVERVAKVTHELYKIVETT